MSQPPDPDRWHRRARHALAHSLRVRLIGLFVLLALAMGVAFLYGMQKTLSVGWRDAARPLVSDYVDRLAADIGSPPDIAQAQAIVKRLPLSLRISGPQVNWRSHPQERDDPTEWHNEHLQEQHGDAQGVRFFERMTADGHRIWFRLNRQAWNEQPKYIGWTTLAVLLLLIALAYARVRRMLRPLDDIRAGAQRFGAGDFGQPIPVRHARRPDQLGELAASINTMGADLQQMLDAKRTLLLAISHELRSPLTRARLNTELLPETTEVQPSRDALLRDLALMRDLVTDLLESERLTNPHAALQREPVQLATLVPEVVASLHAAHAQAGAIRVDLPPTLPVLQLDPTRMRLLLRNLLDNALRHSAEAATAPQVSVRTLPGGATHLSVRDYGPGVTEAQIGQLGQPFYRPDAARTRAGGGVGLGLYLCRLVVQAHGGTFSVRNAQPGLAVEVVLPPFAIQNIA